MQDDLLVNARRQAEKADPSLRAAALLRIARAQSARDVSRARTTLLEGLDVLSKLPNSLGRHLLDEARSVAAAVSPELLDTIPGQSGLERFSSGEVVHVMLAHGHREAAVNYLLHYADPASFPFSYVGNVLYQLASQSSESAARRLALLRHSVEMWRRSPIVPHHHQRGDFVQLFAPSWKELPADEALAVARAIVDQAAGESDTGGSFGYPHEINFTSPRQHTLFQILHVLRHLDPALAQSLIESHDQLAAGARRYPNGLETLHEELKVEAERRKADSATGGGSGYIFAGDPRDFDRQRRLFDATRSGNFELLIEDAIEKYREDTSAEKFNYAPKEYWPSTGAFRTALFEAGKRMGSDAARFLEQIPDDDLRLFATIELAAAVAGVPGASIKQMKQPRPLKFSIPRGTTIDARFLKEIVRDETSSPTMIMRSPDGRLIRCPDCLFRPPASHRWTCKCGHAWNSFATSGKCPACNFQWEVTQCPRCGEVSEHRTWYTSEP